MSGKEQFQKIKRETPYISKDGKFYAIKFYDEKNDCCHYRVTDSHKGRKEENIPTYEDACKLYNIELEETIPTPDQYFIKKVDESSNINVVRTVSDNVLINYIIGHKEECHEAIEKLKEIVRTHEDIKVRKAAYKTCLTIGVEGCEELEMYTEDPDSKSDVAKGKKKPSAHQSKLYNPPVGEFGFCCEEEKMAIVFSHINKKSGYDFESFQREFKTRYRYEASILNQAKMKKLFHKYYSYLMNGKIAKIQAERRRRITTDLPTDILNVLTSYGLRVVRADGRGTSHKVSKSRRKRQYDQDRLSGYRIISIKKGIPIAGKKYELYENDVRDFIDKLKNGEISLEQALEKERA